MYTHMYIYIYTHTHTHTHTYIYIYIYYICKHAHTHAHTYQRRSENIPKFRLVFFILLKIAHQPLYLKGWQADRKKGRHDINTR